jgi:DNA-binding MarR family transcriptional regulator
MRSYDPTDASTGDLLMQAARGLRRAYLEALAPWDVTPGQARALGIICAHAPVRLSALADLLYIVPRSATQVVDALEAHGLVARQPDPVDRRATCVVATAEGERLHEEFHRARAAESERYFAVLSERDRAELERILRLLVE